MVSKAEHLRKQALDMFGTTKPTKEEFAYLIDMQRASNYILRNHTIGGRPITFNVPNRNQSKALGHRPWQVDILNDTHPNVVVRKSRQLGLSEVGVEKMIHFADTHSYAKVKALYAFPTGNQMDTFVKTRLNPQLNDGYYASTITGDSIKSKQLRDSFLIFRTSSRPSTLEGVDIDWLALDEYDRVPALAESSALQTLKSSEFKVLNRWSTPTSPDVGIDKLFKQSDQNYYYHKCSHCNHWNLLSHELYDPSKVDAGGNIKLLNPDGIDKLAGIVVPGTFQYVCQKCGKPLDRWYNGEWIPNYPDRTKNGEGIRGYHISQLNAVWISADEIKQAEMTDSSKQMFYNYTVGIPYENAGMKVYDADVYNHSYDSFGPVFNRDNYKFLSVGIDWGKNHWLVVMGITHDGEKHILNFKSVEKPSTTDMMNMGADMEQIKLFISRYTPDIVVADVGDSGDKVSQLMNYFGKEYVYGCSYKSTPRSTGQIEAKWSETNNIVTVDKLMQNKRYINMLKAGDILHYQRVDSDEYLPLYVEHWQNVIIREEDDQDTGEIYEIITRKGDDHFSQSSVYALLGLERLQNIYSNDPNSFNNSTAIDISFNQNGY